MDITQQGIILLMKSAITGEACTLPPEFDLEQAAQIMLRHQVVPLGYVGAAQCGYGLQTPVMQKMFLKYGKAASLNARQALRIQKLCALFEENGIDYMPVKGCNMKPRYPAPELRYMGDADILIRLEQYPQIRPLMLQLGYTESVESDHELIWLCDDLMVELHKRLIPSYNKDYYSYYGNGWKLAKFQEDHRFYMGPEDEFIYLFTHFAKHYRDGGIGLRQLLDLWVFRREYPRLDESYIEQVLKKMQLDDFFRNIMQVLDAWFCGGSWNEKTEFISQVIFHSGAWGTHDNHSLSNLVKQKQSQVSASSKLRRVRALAFPSREIMAAKYPVLEKAPVLLPVCWVRRVFDSLLFRQDRIRYLATLTPSRISQYEQDLAYVGLAFHFEE